MRNDSAFVSHPFRGLHVRLSGSRINSGFALDPLQKRTMRQIMLGVEKVFSDLYDRFGSVVP
jgi:hypothetical protein